MTTLSPFENTGRTQADTTEPWRRIDFLHRQVLGATLFAGLGCGNSRVVFNVGGNKYRLVVEMQYRAGIAWAKFIGTHAQYDRIDVETVKDHQAHSQRR